MAASARRWFGGFFSQGCAGFHVCWVELMRTTEDLMSTGGAGIVVAAGAAISSFAGFLLFPEVDFCGSQENSIKASGRMKNGRMGRMLVGTGWLVNLEGARVRRTARRRISYPCNARNLVTIQVVKSIPFPCFCPPCFCQPSETNPLICPSSRSPLPPLSSQNADRKKKDRKNGLPE